MRSRSGRLSKITQLQVKDGGKVHIQMKLDADYRKNRVAVLSALKLISWVQDPEISVAAEVKSQQPAATKQLKKVGKVIAVSSCNGGVGKSTIAVNLTNFQIGIQSRHIRRRYLRAQSFHSRRTQRPAPTDDPKSILSLEYERVMFYGFVSQKNAVLRGPLVSALRNNQTRR